MGCSGITLAPSEDEGEEQAIDSSDLTQRVVLVELFNIEGCPACKALNPIVEEVVSGYSTDQVILVELKGWGKGGTIETDARFSWYVPGERHTPYIAFDGQYHEFSHGVSGGGSSGGGSNSKNHAPRITSIPKTHVTVDEVYTYDVNATDLDSDSLSYSLSANPVGMTINSATGLILWTPTAIGDYNVTIKVSDGDLYDTQSFTITVHSILNSITVLPETMTLQAGESDTIFSITATYEDSSEQLIDIEDCSYSSDNELIVTISNGVINGIDAGSAIVTVSYTEGEITRSDSIEVTINTVVINRRALLVGIGNYQYGDNDLLAPPYDVDVMHDVLNHSGADFNLITELKDLQATKNNILSEIASTFNQADENDVSYFYFSGHGAILDQIAYLCPSDFNIYVNTAISVNELESALNNIPGTKVVILDSCHSGGFVGRGRNYQDPTDYLEDFNNNVINTFRTNNLSKSLTSSQYQVLTSCLSSQTCSEFWPSEGDPFGLFTNVLCEGCGYAYYSHPYLADNDENGEITLNEAYNYTYQQVNAYIDLYNSTYGSSLDQDTQVYPESSNFVIINE